MRTSPSPDASARLVYLSAIAINSLIQSLPKGTAYCIGIVLIVMMTGRLVQSKGSLARAALPLVMHLKWGWHRVERAMERGKLSMDGLIEQAHGWCLQHLEVEPVCLGPHRRRLLAADCSTIARPRSKRRESPIWGKGYCHLAGRAVRAHVVAALVSVVLIGEVRLGLLRRLCFGDSAETATERLFAALPQENGPYVILVDAGMATKEQFAAATPEHALAGRLRKNCRLRSRPPSSTGKRGRPRLHGKVVHPGWTEPEVAADEELWVPGDKGNVRLRRWRELHHEGYHQTVLDVLRVDDPAYKQPLLVGTTATELSTLELYQAYPQRWPVEVLFYVGQDSTATEMPRAWTDTAVTRRIGFGLLAGSLLKAIAATADGIAMGPWDRNPQPTAGRLANYLDSHIMNFAEFALQGVEPRNYRKNPQGAQARDLEWEEAA
jgi:hypothetical protein